MDRIRPNWTEVHQMDQRGLLSQLNSYQLRHSYKREENHFADVLTKDGCSLDFPFTLNIPPDFVVDMRGVTYPQTICT